jgi:site-specific recombinase XerD
MIVDKEAFTVNDIYRTYIGAAKDKIAYTVEYFNDYLLKIKKLVDKDMEESTWKKFENSLEHLKDFIKWKYNQQDILLNDINLFFIQEYEFYLKAIKELVNSTIHKVIQRFKKVIIHAKNEGLIQKNPFASYKSISVNKENECK